MLTLGTDTELQKMLNSEAECEFPGHAERHPAHDLGGAAWRVLIACTCDGQEIEALLCNKVHELLMWAVETKDPTPLANHPECGQQLAAYEVYKRSLPI